MIAYIDYFVPKDRVGVYEVIEAIPQKDLPPAFADKAHCTNFFDVFLGLREVAYANDISTTGMLQKLLDTFFEDQHVCPSAIKWIIIAGELTTSGETVSNVGHYLQHNYKMHNANVIHFSGNHCSNIEYAIDWSEGILAAYPATHILILAAKRMATLQERLVGAYAVKGDGAAIAYLNNVDQHGIDVIGTYAYTNGGMYEANVNASDLITLYNDYTVCLRGLIHKFNITPTNISHVLIQNANHLLTMQTLQMLGFKEEQVFLANLGTYGHLDCIDFIVNLQTICTKKQPANAQMISFGTGYAGSYIAMYMESK